MRMIWTRIFLVFSSVLLFVQGSPQLLYALRKEVRLMDAGNPQGNFTTIVSGLDDAAAVDFIYSEQTIVWTDISLTAIRQAWIHGNREPRDIITVGLVSPDGLACDWIGKKIYWTDSETNLIEVSNLDGSYRKVLFWEDIDQPRAIALHPKLGYLFWTDWGENSKIERAGMDGNPDTREVIISDEIHWPNGLTIDYDESRLYWADAKLSYIRSCNFDGSNRQTILEEELPHVFSLTLYEDSLYWTDWQTKAIHTCDKHTGNNRTDRTEVFKHADNHSPMDIHVFSAKRQPWVPNPCGKNNGGCSHLCLMAPFPPHYSCACPTGVRLQEDNKTCANGSKEILLLARRSDLRRISLDTPDYTDVVLQLDNVRHAIAIDYDPVENYVYWTDDETRAIQRALIDGSNQEVVISAEVDHPDGLAVDWIARNLYWTDTGTDRIEVARLNGTSRRVLISEKLEEPRAIVLDPMKGYMYWSDWGEHPKIERANLDGSARIVLVNTSIGWPNGLALDFKEQKVYWGDAQTDKIEVINMDGTNRRVIVDDQLPHIFGFSLLGDYLYWTDWQSRSIHRVNKSTGRGKESIIEQLPDLMGLKAVDVHHVEGTNDCYYTNNGCSHLCLNRPAPLGPICACPMGLELLANGKTCIVPEAFLLFTHRTDIRRISLETTHNDVVIPLAGVEEALCLDFDINDNRIYWTDAKFKSISRAFMNGSSLEHVIEHGLNSPEGMAVDWVARQLYWADPGYGGHKVDIPKSSIGRIEMARMDGSARKVLVWKDVEPRTIALDPPKGYMYWNDWRDGGRIERASLDGSHRSQLVHKTGRSMGLTIDFSERKLYWTNIDSNDIECSDMDGSNRAVVLHGLPYPYGLTQYQDYIYWTDWEKKSIEKANKTTGLNRTTIQDNLQYITDISVFHASRQSGWNECHKDNGKCSHLCIAHSAEDHSIFTHHCTCPTHYKLDTDNQTCIAPESFLLYSQKAAISRMLIDTNDEPDIVLPINKLKNVKALEYDPIEQYIYWIDYKSKSIRKAKDNGTHVQTILNGNQGNDLAPYDFALDPYTRKIYWTDQKNNVINVTGMDGKSIGVIVEKTDEKDQRPRDIVLAPKEGLMFWVNMVKPPRIERAEMDGTAPVTLFERMEVSTSLTLAIDPHLGKIFWADNNLKRIESADFGGGNRRVLADQDIDNPVGLAVSGDILFWVDRERNMLEGMDKRNGGNRASRVSRVKQLSDIHAVSPLSRVELEEHPCTRARCSHLCFADNKEPDKHRCSCPVGLVLSSDDRTCAEPPTCEHDEFSCHVGSISCVPMEWKCDGVAECDDGSDEKDCTKCSDDEFKCASGKCVSLKYRCNGKRDCDDSSDEEWCAPCEANYFECKYDHVCISHDKVCDGNHDCKKGEDEDEGCEKTPGPYPHKSNSATQYTIIVVVGLLVTMAILVVLVFACRKKHQQSTLLDDPAQRDIVLVTKLIPGDATGSTPPHTLSGPKSRGSSKTSASHSLLHYDRNHVTGASSTGSSVTQYPKETLNPPPSPVTDRSQCLGELYSSSASPSTVRSYLPSRHKHRVPPRHTTPCSTDVCEDSEPYPHSSEKYYTFYESDTPYNPPPTPVRSNYFSDDVDLSLPPSPTTVRSERSFYSPYNPPPSPVGTSDC